MVVPPAVLNRSVTDGLPAEGDFCPGRSEAGADGKPPPRGVVNAEGITTASRTVMGMAPLFLSVMCRERCAEAGGRRVDEQRDNVGR